MISGKSQKHLFYLINGLTIFRIILALLVMGLIFSGYHLIAFFIFLLGVLTDLLDGDLARRYHLTSEIGKNLDGLADISLIYGAIIPLFILGDFSTFVEIAIIIATFLILAAVFEHTLKNKKLTMPGRKPSTTINSYFVYTCLALFIINSPYKYPMVYLTLFIIALTAFDYFIYKEN